MAIEIIELDKNIQVVVIRNYLNKTEFKEVWNELCAYLKVSGISNDQALSGAATIEGKSISTFKENVFINSRYSSFRKYHKKFFNEIGELIKNKTLSVVYNGLFNTNQDGSWFAKCFLNHEYQGHTDVSVFTQLYYIHKEPKKFTGGDLFFNDYNYTLPYENNMLVLFPGFILHSVTKVESNVKLKENENRFVFTTFYGCNILPNDPK
jgi:Rps23 Pro-64 3,4-dihydroxylase Tpa1-like proline 4-hydroxylase